MLLNRVSAGLAVAMSLGGFSVGCFGNKNKDVAEGPPPPPAAYPESSTGYSSWTAIASATNPVNDPTMSYQGASAGASSGYREAAAPGPFQLREGEQLVEHRIESGESLSSIAGKYNSSVSRIQAANGMTDTKIFAGKTLQVPTSAMTSGLAMNATAGAASPYSAPAGQTAPVPPGVQLQSSGQVQIPVSPASTSYSRSDSIPAPAPAPGAFPTPSFQGSGIQFSN